MRKQKVHNNKHNHQDCQDYRYKDNYNTLEMVLLLVVNNPLQQKINEQEAQGKFINGTMTLNNKVSFPLCLVIQPSLKKQ